MMGDSASSAEFFVGVGVICFLYSMVALLIYLGYMHVYKNSDFGPIFVSLPDLLHLDISPYYPLNNRA